jgi:hypothetical protein
LLWRFWTDTRVHWMYKEIVSSCIYTRFWSCIVALIIWFCWDYTTFGRISFIHVKLNRLSECLIEIVLSCKKAYILRISGSLKCLYRPLIKQKGIYTTYTQHIKGIYDTYIEEPIYAVAQKTNFGLSLLQAPSSRASRWER